MPGNPQECRKHAANCKRFAAKADTPEAKEHFIGLATQWEQLAAELEASRRFLKTLQEIEPEEGV